MAKKVLICDDAEYMRAYMCNILKNNGYELYEAEDGYAAVEKYKQHNPDVVLLDVTMPGLDGFMALTEILKYDSEAKVIMCSAMGVYDIIEKSLNAGAIDYIIKPFQPARIKEAVKKAVS